MKLCALVLLVCTPAAAAKTSRFTVGARVARSVTISARILDGRVEIDRRGRALSRTRVEPAGNDRFRVTVLF